MKIIILLSALVILFIQASIAQTMETGMMPESDGKTAEYTDWKKVEFSGESGRLTYEYRIAFTKRKAMACYYDLQIKNTSTERIDFKVKSHYDDLLVKKPFGDEYKASIKPDKITSFEILTQGCKGDKDQKEQDDFDRCRNHCGLSYEIYAGND